MILNRNAKILVGFLICLPVAFVFQNCGNIAIQSPLEVAAESLSLASGSGQLCIEESQVLESVFVSNLNSTFVNSDLFADSDGDGISDVQEIRLGTDPLNRRSNSLVLDRICQKVDYQVRCENLHLTCSGTHMGWGLNDCDVEALQLNMLYDHPQQGLDTDKDSIPDYMEIRAGTFPNIADSTQDPDHDLRSNLAEIELGTDASIAELQLPDKKTIQIRKTKLSSTTSCRGQLWNIEILALPLIPTQAFYSNNESEFNHATNENVIAVVYKTRPKIGVVQNAKMYTLIKKMPFNPKETILSIPFEFDTIDFTKQGEIEP